MSGCVFWQRNVIGRLVNRQMMLELRRMQSSNAVMSNYWGFSVLWNQSGRAARATFGFFNLVANGLSLASCVKPFDLFPMAGVGCLDDMSYKI